MGFLIKIDLLDAVIKHMEKPDIYRVDVISGKPFGVTVTMKNTGTIAWANSGPGKSKSRPSTGHSYALASPSPSANEKSTLFGEKFTLDVNVVK